MSRFKERKEKDCLNCGTEVQGRFCHFCGQENIEPKETVWELVSHFFKDITHFDGKFFSTVKYLVFRPGFLPKEYMKGRRASHVNPIRLYIFTSAFFFLVFFSFYQNNDDVIIIQGTRDEILAELQDNRTALLEKISEMPKPDSSADYGSNEKIKAEKRLQDIDDDIRLIKQDSTAVNRLKTLNFSSNFFSYNSQDSSGSYATLREYDSIQQSLPKNKRDGFIVSRIVRQNLHLREKYNNNGRAVLASIFQNFMKRFPQMLFVSLPLFALLLKLLYARRKIFYYVNHIIYSVHLYCASFIIILANLWTGSILGWFSLEMPQWLKVLFALTCFFYMYKAQRNFYGQGRAKTLLKFCLLLFLTIILMALLFSVFFIFSTFSL